MKAAHEARGEGRGPRGPGGPEGPRGPGKRHHGMMGGGFDGNKDGTVTRDEFMARPLAMFEKTDANKDGVVTADEAKAARAQFGKDHGGRGGHGGHGGKWGRGGPGGDMPPPPEGDGDMPPPPPPSE